MPDITKCPGKGCPIKDDCYRFTSEPSLPNQTYFFSEPFYHENGKIKCDYFYTRGNTGLVWRGDNKKKTK